MSLVLYVENSEIQSYDWESVFVSHVIKVFGYYPKEIGHH